MRYAQLGDLGEFKNGVNFKRDQMGRGVPLINVKDITGSHRIDIDSLDLVEIKAKDEMFAREDDLFFVRSSVKLDGIALSAKLMPSDTKAIHCGFVIRFRPTSDELCMDYLLYLLRNWEYRERLKGLSGGAAIVNISQGALKGLSIPLPSLPQQKRIAYILSTYDNLIENNRRRIQLLEQAARLLYREWFVHLRFPGHEHVKIKDGVPEGWEKKTIGEFAPFKYGKALKKDDRVPGPFPVYGSSGIVGTHEKALVTGPAIIVGRKGNVGSVYWSKDDFHPIDTVYFIEAEHCTIYLYYALLHTHFINTDVAVPGLNRDFAHSRTLLITDDKILALFEQDVTIIHDQIDQLAKYNKLLTQARDLLLPRLMNGEVAV
jgi:type I restriction enzyme S subunit